MKECVNKLLHICEQELTLLDMAINAKKSACVRIGSRFRHHCSTVYIYIFVFFSNTYIYILYLPCFGE